jgi:hypothetical protein
MAGVGHALGLQSRWEQEHDRHRNQHQGTNSTTARPQLVFCFVVQSAILPRLGSAFLSCSVLLFRSHLKVAIAFFGFFCFFGGFIWRLCDDDGGLPRHHHPPPHHLCAILPLGTRVGRFCILVLVLVVGWGVVFGEWWVFECWFAYSFGGWMGGW